MEPTRYVCQSNMCNGCMACLHVCKKDAITVYEEPMAYNAVIDPSKCVNCGQCEKVCPRCSTVEAKPPTTWVQGWAKDSKVRQMGASGGYASAIMQAFIAKWRGCVVSCIFQEGDFRFAVARTVEECGRFCGSKYVKSNPKQAYTQVQALLREGEKVLFIGLPCQVAGIKNAISLSDQKNLYTIDLICHGTPAPRLLGQYIGELQGKDLVDISSLVFRQKMRFVLSCETEMLLPIGVQDRYMMAFLNSLDYTENCYHCEYAKTERISDISLGDSWAGNFPESEIHQGVSLALCQTEKGKSLLYLADIEMQPADVDASIAANKQLRKPSVAPKPSKRFWKCLAMGLRFKTAVFVAYPQNCIRQKVKELLIKMHMRKN